MKFILSLILLLPAVFVNAQTRLVPSKKVVNKKWLKDQQYQMTWYAIKDTSRSEIGKVTTRISSGNNRITVVTHIDLKKNKSSWVDTTIANTKDLRPVYHSSYNAQRDMVLYFGKIVTGFYTDKINKTTSVINDTTNEYYFDSNIYPALITWLPLNEDYKQDISIYDYNPRGKTGVLRATVKEVKKGSFATVKSGVRQVWIVTISDEIGGEDAVSNYYIDIADRKLWKLELDAGGRKMMMELVEN